MSFQKAKKRAPLGIFHRNYNYSVGCPCNIYRCANRISMRLFFDLQTRVRILKSSISDLRTRVNIARAGHRIIIMAVFGYQLLMLDGPSTGTNDPVVCGVLRLRTALQ